jgi:Trypsin-co-occurring domain 1
VPTQVVAYEVDDSTKVLFEIEPAAGFVPAGGAGQVLGRITDAVGPAVEAAKAVLDKVKDMQPDGVEVRFGVKASGGADWLVAKAAGEASFEITLTWTSGREREPGRLPAPGPDEAGPGGTEPVAAERPDGTGTGAGTAGGNGAGGNGLGGNGAGGQ